MAGSLYADEGTISATSAAATPISQASHSVSTSPKKSKKNPKEVWACPMGDYTGPKTKDGKCPTCGMDLVKQEKAPVKKDEKKEETKPSAQTKTQKTVWVCPMGDFTGDKPGKCPNCGMDLVEKK